jgi:hypothetical protein
MFMKGYFRNMYDRIKNALGNTHVSYEEQLERQGVYSAITRAGLEQDYVFGKIHTAIQPRFTQDLFKKCPNLFGEGRRGTDVGDRYDLEKEVNAIIKQADAKRVMKSIEGTTSSPTDVFWSYVRVGNNQGTTEVTTHQKVYKPN